MDPAFGTFGHRAITRMPQPALHVAEGVEIRDEFDAERGARVVEFAELGRCQRRGFPPGVFVSGEREGVLDVELELVRAQTAQRADEGEELGLRRHARARDVEHEAAHGQVRRIGDLEVREFVGVLLGDLAERLRAIEHAARVAGVEADAAGEDFDMIAFGAALRLRDDPAGAFGFSGQGRPGFVHRRRQSLYEGGRRVGQGRYLEPAPSQGQFPWAGEEREHRKGHGTRVRPSEPTGKTLR